MICQKNNETKCLGGDIKNVNGQARARTFNTLSKIPNVIHIYLNLLALKGNSVVIYRKLDYFLFEFN